MRRTWLLLDCNYLAYRALYTTGSLKHGLIATGVLYGFMRDILSLQELHATSNLVFCFDYGKGFRHNHFPDYKSSRRNKERTEEEQDAFRSFQEQVKALRREYLPELGYQNVLFQKGYEADDIIASVCHNSLGKRDEAIIVSADHDLYQLLSERVLMYNPAQQKATTEQSFREKYMVSPAQWVDVKAIAGCNTDNIIGVKGVGEITAAKFLCGLLKPDSKTSQAIVQGNKLWKKNLLAVKLPYPGVDTFELSEDSVTDRKWRRLADRLGMASLRNGMEPKKPKRKGFGL